MPRTVVLVETATGKPLYRFKDEMNLPDFLRQDVAGPKTSLDYCGHFYEQATCRTARLDGLDCKHEDGHCEACYRLPRPRVEKDKTTRSYQHGLTRVTVARA